MTGKLLSEACSSIRRNSSCISCTSSDVTPEALETDAQTLLCEEMEEFHFVHFSEDPPVSLVFEIENQLSGQDRVLKHVGNPFTHLHRQRNIHHEGRHKLLSHPRHSPYLPSDVNLPFFSSGQPCSTPNLFEGYRLISEQEMRRMGTSIYLSRPEGKQPIVYDPLHKFVLPNSRRFSW
eukprot:EG_transcript_26925